MSDKTTTTMPELTPEETNMILAALRLWQDSVNDGSEYLNEQLIGIATDGGNRAMLDDVGIDELCEKINE